VIAAALCLSSQALGRVAVAQEQPAPGEAGAREQVETVGGPPESLPSADEEAARRRAYSTGIVMLGGILICGVSLVALALLWGNRMRRIARQPLPKVAPRDDLWYLKAKDKPDVGDANVGDTEYPS